MWLLIHYWCNWLLRLRNCDGYPLSDCAVVRTDSRQLSTVFDCDCCQDRISSFATESNDRMKSESYRILSEIFRRNPIGFRQRGFRRNAIGTCPIASAFEYSRLNPVVFSIGLDRNPWSERSTWVFLGVKERSVSFLDVYFIHFSLARIILCEK